MSCSSTAASRALPGGSSISTGKGGGGGPFPAVAPELGEDRLLVWVFGFTSVSVAGRGAWLVRVFSASSGGEMGAHKWGDFFGPVPDT